MKNWDEMMQENEMGTQAKKNNKGFSLVELIIVIAIMAILVGVVGTQVLPYLEKSREAKDLQIVSSIGTAATTAFAEYAGQFTADETLTFNATTNGKAAPTAAETKIISSLQQLLGVTNNVFLNYLSNTPATDTTATKLESKRGKDATYFTVVYDYETGAVTVQLYSSAGTLFDPVISK